MFWVTNYTKIKVTVSVVLVFAEIREVLSGTASAVL